MSKCCPLGLSLVAVACLSPAAAAEVIITEIMYNPDSTEGGSNPLPDGTQPITRCEWVEVTNVGDEAVDLAGWTLQDRNGSTLPLPSGATLEPGAVAVLAPDTITPGDFAEAWGEGVTVWTVGQWEDGGLRNLANNPKSGEELKLVDAEGASVDEVNYLSGGDWPFVASPDGRSIYLKADAMTSTDNDTPGSWSASKAGEAGAKAATQTTIFDGQDIGSPGTLPGEDESTSTEADQPD